uniref:Uncharacterized protein n=1 Tax=Cairina moschata TaxID=8855 RepID=A0A8C3CUB6_CAIMO
MRISMTSVFHQPILRVHIMSHQNSVFVAFIDQHPNPAKVKSLEKITKQNSSFWSFPCSKPPTRRPSVLHCTQVTLIPG